MRHPSLSLLGFLWAWLPLFYCQPVKIERVIADAKGLAEIIIARIQGHQFPPVSLRIHGLDFIPEELPMQSLETVDAALGIFHRVLSSLPYEAPVAQISNDVENLQSLMRLLGVLMGCPIQRPPSSDDLGNLTELLANSPYTTSAVTLGRLQRCLQSMGSYLDYGQHC
ncbi:leptin [Sceloporus undulatus]|uniref:leptin n=1 Tax=Sceloporus undulatus TaxID=8520 RepID=UPI001C4C8883|nr:leptin [Sceloporus undulatus]